VEAKKDLQLALNKAKEEVGTLHRENDILTLSCDQLAIDNATLELENQMLRRELHKKELLISNRAYMAFSSYLKQVEYWNLGVHLTYKGVNPLHDVVDGKLLDYNNDPPTCVDLNDPELEAYEFYAPVATPLELVETEDPLIGNVTAPPSTSAP
jgi:hypothetical protein